MLFSPTAFATPSVGAESVVISQSTVDGIDYITRDIIIQPGGSTGWHYHDGRTFGVVREGTLTRTMEDCSEMISPTGVGVTEEGGNVHVGRNLGPVPVVLWVVRIAPSGHPVGDGGAASARLPDLRVCLRCKTAIRHGCLQGRSSAW
jgi:quercetin dioxygenase-like cupin family protein